MDVAPLKAAWFAQCARKPRKRLLVFLGIAFLPSVSLAGWLGFRFARALPGLDPAVAGLSLGAGFLALGLLSGLWDGTCVLRFEPFLPFQASPFALFLAEVAVGLTTPAKLLLWALVLAAGLGVALARPLLLPVLPLLLPLPLLTQVALERLWGALARFLGRSFQTLLLFATLFLGMRRLIASMLKNQALREVPLEGLVARVAGALPTTRLIAGFQALLSGRGLPPAALLLPWLWIMALLLVVFATLHGELCGKKATTGIRGHAASPWRFARPWMGVALHHGHTLRHSKLGRFTVFMPILALMTLTEPLFFGFRVTSSGGSIWIIAWMGWVMLPLGKLACDVFGFDRGGVRTFWLLPLEDRDLLVGKALATGAWQAFIILLLVLSLAFATPLTAAQCAAAALFCTALALAQLRVGLRFSCEHARPLDPEGLNPNDLDDVQLKKLGLLLGPWLRLLILWAVTVWFGPACLLATMGAVLAWELRRLLRDFPGACAGLERQRDALTTALEGDGTACEQALIQ